MSGLAILAIIIIIGQMMSKASKAAEQRPAAPPDDLEQAARTWRIQEEIRRKIAERRGGLIPPPADLSSPVAGEAPPTPPAYSRPIMTRPLVDPFGGPRMGAPRAFETRPAEPPPLPVQPSAELERQEEYAAKMADLQEEQAADQETADARAAETNWTESTRTASGPSAWRNDLRSPTDLRRAIVLRELLGPPLALRCGHDSAFS
jgi:hypothetical protein